MTEEILSTGIDVGTTTTHLIISRLVLAVKEGFGCAPKVEIVHKEIIYQSDIYFTPLEPDGRISAIGVKDIIISEYSNAGVTPNMLGSGAVIITGESARRRNAKELLYEISDYAGDFIVAEAGGETESILAGKGTGAQTLSDREQCKVACVDIGGGTTNISVFDCGKAVAASCIDVGGRLIKIDDNRVVTYISPYVSELLCSGGVDLSVGNILERDVAQKICRLLMHSMTDELNSLPSADRYIFSGGVSSCCGRDLDDYCYGDLGVMLWREIENSEWYLIHNCTVADNAIRATVIGAGNYSFDISGSTIACIESALPIRNIPCVGLSIDCPEDIASAFDGINRRLSKYSLQKPVALSFSGYKSIGIDDMLGIAHNISDALGEYISNGQPVIVLVEQDIGKAMGVCLKKYLPKDYPVLCIDCVSAEDGDYIDIAKSVGGGRAVPVSVKKLVFSV
ncbi:MAG: ethanolamine ammonia-lyase reactivating factor EutA [Oscillospiraceae bacterium]|nr:ethanolamine ammonia-lyase reactivating factor EutA [Oscillospiraceae bacterium]